MLLDIYTMSLYMPNYFIGSSPAINELTYWYTQRRVQPDQRYSTVQFTGIKFECSL